MACRAVCGKIYSIAQAYLSYAISQWEKFDTDCLVLGIEPLELPCNRFFNLIHYFLYQGLDEEASTKMTAQINEVAKSLEHPWRWKPVVEKESWTRDKRGKLIPPADWRPPGWLPDHVAYQNAMKAVSSIG